MQSFSSLATQTDFDKFSTFFQEKFKIVLKENIEFSKSEKISE
jgi:hypothetical protein